MRKPNPRMPLSTTRPNLSTPGKTHLCKLFQQGKCNYGWNCRFAHSISDLRNLGFGIVGNERHQNERNGLCGNRPCYWSFNGKHCPFGERCHFLHKYDQMYRGDEGLQKESEAILVGNIGKDKIGTEEDHRKRAMFYKTRLCPKRERFGSCSYEVKCLYSHGETELESSKTITTNKVQVEDKCFMKWNVEKIGRIYADWIDSAQ